MNTFRKTLATALSFALLGSIALTSSASVTDNPRWSIPPMVIVWTTDAAGSAPLVSEFLVGAPSIDLIAQDSVTVVTGSLTRTDQTDGTAFGGIPFILEGVNGADFNTDTNSDGVLDADDSFAAFDLQANSDARVDAVETSTSFYVASNSAFNINADVVSVNTFALLFFVFLDMSVSLERDNPTEPEFGTAAQFPNSGGETAGFLGMPRTLLSIAAPTLVFEGNQPTAASIGSILDQSVRFDQDYSVGFTGYDLSLGTFDFQAVVEYTVFVP